jgi:hypothetical protein
MPFAVTTPAGHVVRLDDVPLSDLQKIAVDTGLDTWAKILTEPLRNGASAEAVYRFCCEQEGDTPPDRITPKLIIAAFNWVEDDLPDTYQGGLPKAEDDPGTPGSSGAPSDTTGPPPSPEASPFENFNS